MLGNTIRNLKSKKKNDEKNSNLQFSDFFLKILANISGFIPNNTPNPIKRIITMIGRTSEFVDNIEIKANAIIEKNPPIPI